MFAQCKHTAKKRNNKNKVFGNVDVIEHPSKHTQRVQLENKLTTTKAAEFLARIENKKKRLHAVNYEETMQKIFSGTPLSV